MLLLPLLLSAPAAVSTDAAVFMNQVLAHDAMGFSGTAEVDIRLTIRSPRGTNKDAFRHQFSPQGRQHSLVISGACGACGTGMLLRDEADGSSTQHINPVTTRFARRLKQSV